jgi:hypothetical protein
MKIKNNYMKLSNGKHEIETEMQWIVEVKIYSEIQNPTWVMKKQSVNKVMKLINRLPLHKNGFPEEVIKNHAMQTLTNSEDFTVHCFNQILVIYKENLIEIREDLDCAVENEIVKSAPDKIYKEVRHYI